MASFSYSRQDESGTYKFLRIRNRHFELHELFSWKNFQFAGFNWKLPFIVYRLADVLYQLQSQVIIVDLEGKVKHKYRADILGPAFEL